MNDNSTNRIIEQNELEQSYSILIQVFIIVFGGILLLLVIASMVLSRFVPALENLCLYTHFTYSHIHIHSHMAYFTS